MSYDIDLCYAIVMAVPVFCT